MITVEKSDPFSSESHRLIEMLSAELAAITGDSGKSNFTVEAMNDDKALWVLAKNTHGEAIGCGAIRPITQNIAELKKNVFRPKRAWSWGSFTHFSGNICKRYGI
ncbi:hypothetical protein [Klebsiella michiganensis]|uniref:hypothetical protein n=1 Tax=Klebsiella michiganensis TaxID=1134687 RepID=UPI003887A06F